MEPPRTHVLSARRAPAALLAPALLAAVSALAAPPAAGALPGAALAAIEDALAPAASPRSGGEYAEVLTNGTAAARLRLALSLREQAGGADGGTNLARALRLLRGAARDGEPGACYWLAQMCEKGEGMAAPAPDRAFRWAWTGMEATNTACMNLLGTFFERGVGTAADPVAAADYYRQAADLGDAKGALNLGLACEYGRGVPADPARALRCYAAAARAGLPAAMCRVGLCHLYGTGTPRNAVLAAEWFARGARAGDPDAAGFLGRCFARGIAVPRDPAAALPWLRTAVNGGRLEFQPDLVQALRDAGPSPGLRTELVLHLVSESGGVPSRCAAEVAALLTDPAWGEPDLEAAADWLERGGPGARASAHAARQRLARAAFDVAAARAESAAHASETLVLRGLRLGMPAEEAARLLEAELAAAGAPRELIVEPAPGGGVRAACDLAEIVGGAGEGNPVEEVWVSRGAVDALFGTKGMPLDTERLAVLGSAGVLSRAAERRTDAEVRNGGRRVGTQRRVLYASPEGWELVFHGPLAVFDDRPLDGAREARAFRPAGSFSLRRRAGD